MKSVATNKIIPFEKSVATIKNQKKYDIMDKIF